MAQTYECAFAPPEDRLMVRGIGFSASMHKASPRQREERTFAVPGMTCEARRSSRASATEFMLEAIESK